MSEMTPREIVHELDQHIIGQAKAKKAVSIALRNRWRRMQLSDDLRTEATPKNILMIGLQVWVKLKLLAALQNLLMRLLLKLKQQSSPKWAMLVKK